MHRPFKPRTHWPAAFGIARAPARNNGARTTTTAFVVDSEITDKELPRQWLKLNVEDGHSSRCEAVEPVGKCGSLGVGGDRR